MPLLIAVDGLEQGVGLGSHLDAGVIAAGGDSGAGFGEREPPGQPPGDIARLFILIAGLAKAAAQPLTIGEIFRRYGLLQQDGALKRVLRSLAAIKRAKAAA